MKQPLLISRSILGNYRTGEFLFQYPIILPFHTFHGVLKARILKWFAIPISSEPHSVRPLHHDPSVLGGPTQHGLVSLSYNDLCSFPRQTNQYHRMPRLSQPIMLKKLKLNSSVKPTRPSRTNTQKRCPFHHRGLECKSWKSRNTWNNRQIWPWSME